VIAPAFYKESSGPKDLIIVDHLKTRGNVAPGSIRGMKNAKNAAPVFFFRAEPAPGYSIKKANVCQRMPVGEGRGMGMTKKAINTYKGSGIAARHRKLQKQVARTTDKRAPAEEAARPMRAGARHYPEPPFPRQHLPKPGHESRLRPAPMCDAPFYEGSGQAEGQGGDHYRCGLRDWSRGRRPVRAGKARISRPSTSTNTMTRP
jgi:hypothetical protein